MQGSVLPSQPDQVALSQPGRPRGRPRELHADAVVDAALDLGLSGVTLAAIAQHLGVGIATVYRCVPGLDQLRDVVLSRLVGEAPWPHTTLPWPQYLDRLGLAVAAVLNSHRGVAEFCEPAAFANTDLLRVFGSSVTALVSQGFTTRDAIVAVDLVMHVTFDSMRNAHAEHSTADARSHAFGHGLPREVSSAAIAIDEGMSRDDVVRLKLRITIAGIESVRADGQPLS